MLESADVQKQIQTLGEDILKRMEGQSKVSLFSKDFWYGSIMDWSMKNEKFKTQMFRFVDVLPSLQSNTELSRHLKEYFADSGGDLPGVFNVGLGLGSLAPSLMAGAIRKNVTQMAKMFITGENPQEALPVIKKMRKQKLAFTLDILGEATLSEREALDYQRRYLELINWLAKDSETWEDVALTDKDHSGAIPKVNVSVKLTALYSKINDRAWDTTKSALKERLRPILSLAKKKQVFINLDMEHYGVKHLTLEVFKELLLETEYRDYPFFGCVIQAYLRDSQADIEDLAKFAKTRGTPFTIRLVKGAYWDSETIEAQQKRWDYPVYTNKQESDANYEQCAELILRSYPYLRGAFATHNVRTIAATLVCAKNLAVPANSFEVQMLYGMADPIKKSLVDLNIRVREYAPVGELIPGMAYLVRRLLENTSNESWLRGKFAEGQTAEKLLRNPQDNLLRSQAQLPPENRFHNFPLTDFAVLEARQKIHAQINTLRSSLPKVVKPVVAGQEVSSSKVVSRENPSKPSEILAQVHYAELADAERALQSAKAFFPEWRKTSAETRCQLLEKLAAAMVRDKFRLAATQVLEVGKPWTEADADVAEAIDFCNYYARLMRAQSTPQKVGGVPGEDSQYTYVPRGVTLVIAPWNFPLAIICGMAVGALVSGNTVILKPAEQSSLVAQGLIQLMKDVGFPAQAVQFLPGLGEEVGDYLVNHKDIATIVFTGSKAVGLHILQRSALVQSGQGHVKRCIIEMGGKNAIIVDNDADLDEAVDGVLYSAFGFAGQKCSACSRVIVVDEVYDRFVDRLVQAAESYVSAPADSPEADLGPVVDKDAYQRIRDLIAREKQNHQLLFEGKVHSEGYFVPPTIFSVKNPEASLAQEEIFGPVLAVMRAKDFEEAIQLANGTHYALTGGVFSRSPAHIQKARENFECGNLYINRGITGAMVDRHPFGGFKLSGVGAKTGGPDYLRQFMDQKCVTENTMRRGFAPGDT
jgi:RHH-type proline utilization regulon transcriptional repressor/proline dehydrogenase/delta 1-pyrroline-5-carboxylate dehydrogenase